MRVIGHQRTIVCARRDVWRTVVVPTTRVGRSARSGGGRVVTPSVWSEEGKGRRRAARNGRRNVSRARITKHGRTAAPDDRRTVGVVFFFSIFFSPHYISLTLSLSPLPLLLIKRLIPCDCVRAGARSRTLTPVPSAFV